MNKVGRSVYRSQFGAFGFLLHCLQAARAVVSPMKCIISALRRELDFFQALLALNAGRAKHPGIWVVQERLFSFPFRRGLYQFHLEVDAGQTGHIICYR